MIRSDIDISWLNDSPMFGPGMVTEKGRTDLQAPGAKRGINEGAAKKLLKTPAEAEASVEDSLQDNQRTQLQRPNEGKTQEEADTVKQPRKGAIVKLRW